MIRKKNPTPIPPQVTLVEVVDLDGGLGWIRVEGVGQRRWVPDGKLSYPSRSGQYQYDHYHVTGTTTPETYPSSFGLKRYDDGHILPSSVDGATLFLTLAEASTLAEAWLAAGCPGIALEHPTDTKRRRLEANSAFAYRKASYWFSQLTDEDLLRLAAEATGYITKRVELAERAAARAAEKKRKAEEKVAARAAAKAQRDAAKAIKDAEKARKQAEKDALKAEKDALKAERVIRVH